MSNLEKNICIDCDYNNLEIKFNNLKKNKKIENKKIENKKIENKKIDINITLLASNNYCNYCNNFYHNNNNICPLIIKDSFFNIHSNQNKINNIKPIIKKSLPKLYNKLSKSDFDNNIYNDLINLNLDSKFISNKNKKRVTFTFD